MEITAGAVPLQAATQVCHPVSFCMPEITWALLGGVPGGVGVGLALGVGVGLALGLGLVPGPELAMLVGLADLPPQPANRATVKTERLKQTTAFSFLIFGELFLEVAGLKN
jgi:hypothetical protein